MINPGPHWMASIEAVLLRYHDVPYAVDVLTHIVIDTAARLPIHVSEVFGTLVDPVFHNQIRGATTIARKSRVGRSRRRVNGQDHPAEPRNEEGVLSSHGQTAHGPDNFQVQRIMLMSIKRYSASVVWRRPASGGRWWKGRMLRYIVCQPEYYATS